VAVKIARRDGLVVQLRELKRIDGGKQRLVELLPAFGA
jgi:hypothetical protein